MKEIFDQFKVSYEMMCEKPKEIIRDPNLVVQIEKNFYNWDTGAPMIMSYLTFQQPLPIDQTSQSLNNQMLPPGAEDDIFDMNDEEFDEDYDQELSNFEEEYNRELEERHLNL